MKIRILMFLRKFFSYKCIVKDLHQVFLLTSVGGFISVLFQTPASFPMFALASLCFLFGILIGSMED